MASNQNAYIAPEIAEDEDSRLEELYKLQLLDTASELRFDRYASLVADVFGFPVVLISLVDRDRQWFKSRLGWNRKECPRDISFCGHTINEDSLLVVPDALDDPRFADNPLVTGEPYIRFYAGAVVRGPSGYALGTLCLLDHQPRYFDEEYRRRLRQFADLIENEIAHRADLLTLKGLIGFQAYYDSLTQLIELAMVESWQVVVLVFNVSGLHLLNQNLGAEGSDELLRQFAARLQDHRPTGGSVARVQADDFAMVFPVRSENQRADVERQIHTAINRPYHYQGREHYLRVRIGTSQFPDQGDTAEALVEKASAATR